MRYFQVNHSGPDLEPQWSGAYKAEHQWHLPGVKCPQCGTWAGMNAYPSVDLASLGHVALELEGDLAPISPAEYEQKAAAVRPLLRADQPVTPGCSFGPLVGTARGHWGPLTALPPWQLLVREDALAELQAAGLRGIVPVRANLRMRTPGPALYELELRPLARVHPAWTQGGSPPCETCGHPGEVLFASDWKLLGAELPTADAFRVAGAASAIVSDRFVEVMSRLGPSDVAYRELPVA